MKETRNAYRILIGPFNTMKQMDSMNQVNLDKNYMAQDVNLDWTLKRPGSNSRFWY